MPEQLKKPPMGPMPRWLHEEHRVYDLCAAILRYKKARKPILYEWIEELIDLVKLKFDTEAEMEADTLEVWRKLLEEQARDTDVANRKALPAWPSWSES